MEKALGQVAKPNLESMQAINAYQHSNHPSSCTMDKLEIIDIAQEIDTFDISIQPFEDCCTIFAPDRPKQILRLRMRSSMKLCMDVEGLVERAVAGIMITEITPQAEKMKSMT